MIKKTKQKNGRDKNGSNDHDRPKPVPIKEPNKEVPVKESGKRPRKRRLRAKLSSIPEQFSCAD